MVKLVYTYVSEAYGVIRGGSSPLSGTTKNSKIKTIGELSKIGADLRSQRKKIGLVTGCFDVLHIGHIKTFEFAKKFAEVLVVGVDNDRSVAITKGVDRPIFRLATRMSILSNLELVDYVFPVDGVFEFGGEKACRCHRRIIKKLKPDYVITCTITDKFWKDKKKLSEEMGVGFKGYRIRKWASSSEIIDRLRLEM